MPYQQRLTWDGVALHAGGLPGDPESHGCIHLPSEFAEKVMPLLVPGAVRVSTESRILPESGGRRQTIIDSNPPDASAQ